MMEEKEKISKRAAAAVVVAQREQPIDERNVTYKGSMQPFRPVHNNPRINGNDHVASPNNDENRKRNTNVADIKKNDNNEQMESKQSVGSATKERLPDPGQVQSLQYNIPSDDIIDPMHANRRNDENGKSGAIRVAGINEVPTSLSSLSLHDGGIGNDDRLTRMDVGVTESSPSAHVRQDGAATVETTMLQVDGYLPSSSTPNESHYRVPDENVERIEHLYASTESKSRQNDTIEQPSSTTSSRICIGLLLLCIMAVVVIGTVCGMGKFHSTDTPQSSEPKYRAFYSKQELMDAVDIFVSQQNITPSIEETYGNIADWNVSLIQDFSHLFDALYRNPLNRKFNEDISRWDVSSATNMSLMFYGAREFRGDISKWNISRVTDMSGFMAEATFFDSNLSRWDTSNFVNTVFMFYWACNFSGVGLESWNVSNIQNMTGMFSGSSSFRGNLADWDVSNVHDMTEMFDFARLFDSNLFWNVSNVRKMDRMFAGAASFRGRGLEVWSNTTNVRGMESMFEKASRFDANLSTWDVSNVQSMSKMFLEASSFQGLGLENWNTSSATTMLGMFYSAHLFDANLSRWDVSLVNDASYMFCDTSSFQGTGIENWDISNIETMYSMFYFPSSMNTSLPLPSGDIVYKQNVFNANLSKWNVSKVKDFTAMFMWASNFQGIGVEFWNTRNAEMMDRMFFYTTAFDANLSQWDISNVKTIESMFTGASSFRGIGVEKWNTGNITSMYMTFYLASSFEADLSSWDVSKVFNMSFMFADALLFDANLSSWNLSNVQQSSFMFYNAPIFRGIGVENWNTSKIEDMSAMFDGALSFNADLSNWTLSNVQDSSYMFKDAISFQGVGVQNWDTSNIWTMQSMFASARSFDANLSWWNVTRVIDMRYLFFDAPLFQGTGVDRWDTNSVQSMSGMFAAATSFNANLSRWDVSNVVDMSQMFFQASSFHGDGLDVWKVNRVENTEQMFASAVLFNTNLTEWDVSNVTDSADMFQNATSFEGVFWWNDTSEAIMNI